MSDIAHVLSIIDGIESHPAAFLVSRWIKASNMSDRLISILLSWDDGVGSSEICGRVN